VCSSDLGHECINWCSASSGSPQNGTTTTQCTNGSCPNALFVTGLNDWNSTDMNTLWAKPKATNDPCPAGYRVPTQGELTSLNTSFTTKNSTGAYGSPVKMTAANFRDSGNGLLNTVGSGNYWSSTYMSTNKAYFLGFNSSSSSVSNNYRAYGLSVRCVAN
jgi:uncharacterized protein (TIGR02145 family)